MKTWTDYSMSVPLDAAEEHATTCPQCSHTRKKKSARCLSVNTVKQVWYCNHCDWRGGLGSGIENASTPRKAIKPWVPPAPTIVPLTEQQLDWFAERGISPSTLELYGVFGGKAYFGGLEDEVEAIRFPYRYGGTLWSIKSRTMDKKFTRTPAARKMLFGMDQVDFTGPLVWVEGEVDVLACREAGINNVVSVPDGAPAENAKEIRMEYLEECQEFIGKFKTHVLAVDSDGPGRKLEQELSRRLGVDNCKRVTWPPGAKDANDVLVKHGEAQLRECVETAVEYPVSGVFGVRDFMEEMWHDFKHGETLGLSTGFVNLTGMWSVRKGEFTIVTGIPSSGKSAWVTHLMVNMAKNHGWICAVFPAEALPLHRYANSIIELYVGKTMRPGISNRMTDREYAAGAEFVAKHFKFILPKEDDWTVDGVLAAARSAVLRYGVSMVCLDPLMEFFSPHTRDGINSADSVGRELTKMRNFARKNDTHMIVVAHPAKMFPDPKTGLIPRPNGYSLSGSSAFYNKSDGLLICHRSDRTKNVMEVFVEKCRFKIVGRAGTSAYFDYNRLSGVFSPCIIGD